MGLRRFLATYVLPPPPLGGMTAGLWLRILRDNRFSIDPPFWLRAASLTCMSAGTSMMAALERMRFGTAVAATQPRSPIFVLGFWRSGTTHLHNLLATDTQLIAPTTYQALCPHTFLSTQSMAPVFIKPMVEPTRPMDNMAAGLELPQEDEFALCAMTGLSHHMAFAFERSADRYEKYLTFEGVSTAEVECWKRALRTFVKKLVVHQPARIPVLKSPHHTGRMGYLLDVFPDARFVHIHRNPFDVYRSLLHAWQELSTLLQFQRYDEHDLEDRIIERFWRVYRAFFQQRSLIPEDRFYEMSYDQLVAEPLAELAQLYRRFELGGFDDQRPVVTKYLEGIRDYKTNTLPPLPKATTTRLAESWSGVFEALGYSTRPNSHSVAHHT